MPLGEANFRGLRREIALPLRNGQKRTLFETSKVLGKRSGDIQRTVHQMLKEGLLRADDDQPVRGTRFWFNEEDYGSALDAFLESDKPAGQLLLGQRILAVHPKDEEDPYLIIGRSDLSADIAWAAEWGGDGEVLIGMEPSASKRSVDQLAAILKQEGMHCTQRRIGEVLNDDELRRHAASIELVKEVR